MFRNAYLLSNFLVVFKFVSVGVLLHEHSPPIPFGVQSASLEEVFGLVGVFLSLIDELIGHSIQCLLRQDDLRFYQQKNIRPIDRRFFALRYLALFNISLYTVHPITTLHYTPLHHPHTPHPTTNYLI